MPQQRILSDKLPLRPEGHDQNIQQEPNQSNHRPTIGDSIGPRRPDGLSAHTGGRTEGFGVSISHLLGGPTGADSVVMRVIEQPIFQVPKTGFVRRSVSPMRGSKGVDVAFNILPPGQSSGRFPPHRPGVEETLVVVKGQLTLRLDDSHYELNEGDSICYRADHTHQFDNPSQTDETRFIIVINNMPAEY